MLAILKAKNGSDLFTFLKIKSKIYDREKHGRLRVAIRKVTDPTRGKVFLRGEYIAAPDEFFSTKFHPRDFEEKAQPPLPGTNSQGEPIYADITVVKCMQDFEAEERKAAQDYKVNRDMNDNPIKALAKNIQVLVATVMDTKGENDLLRHRLEELEKKVNGGRVSAGPNLSELSELINKKEEEKKEPEVVLVNNDLRPKRTFPQRTK